MTNYESSLAAFKAALFVMAICVLLAVAFPAGASFIDARLVSFQSTDANLNNTGPAGGIGTFELLTDATGTDVDLLGQTFMAQCLEPNEHVSVGNSYTFSVVALADAPTARIGGMGATNARWLELIMAGLGFESVDDVASASAVTRSAVQMATYEASFESSGVFDYAAGSATLTGSGLAASGDIVSALGASTLLEGFALLNIGIAGAPATRSIFTGQDFAVFNAAEVPTPLPLALMGIGLLCIRLAARHE